MSRDYGKIKTALWGSQKYRKIASEIHARHLYLYFHTCPHVNSVGCYRIPIGYMIEDLFWGAEQIHQAIERLVEVDLIDWNADERTVRIVDFIKYDPATNESHAAAMMKDAIGLPDCSQKAKIISELLQQKWLPKDRERLPAEHKRLSNAFPTECGQSVPQSVCQPDGPLPVPVPVPEPNHTSSLRSDVSAEPSALAPDAPPNPDDPVFLSIPTNAKGVEHFVRESDVADYERTYPAVDIRQQIREMRRWSMDNPRQAKTLAGMRRFINSWLAKEQDRPQKSSTNGQANGRPRSARQNALDGAREWFEAEDHRDDPRATLTQLPAGKC